MSVIFYPLSAFDTDRQKTLLAPYDAKNVGSTCVAWSGDYPHEPWHVAHLRVSHHGVRAWGCLFADDGETIVREGFLAQCDDANDPKLAVWDTDNRTGLSWL